jgi:hypothetical protein
VTLTPAIVTEIRALGQQSGEDAGYSDKGDEQGVVED